MSASENGREQLLNHFILANDGLAQLQPHLIAMLSKLTKQIANTLGGFSGRSV
jgi:hypothetical protein